MDFLSIRFFSFIIKINSSVVTEIAALKTGAHGVINILHSVWWLAGDLSESGPQHVVCVDNVKDFTEAFLFSLETQHTIG